MLGREISRNMKNFATLYCVKRFKKILLYLNDPSNLQLVIVPTNDNIHTHKNKYV